MEQTKNENFLNEILKKWKKDIEIKNSSLYNYYIAEEALIYFKNENEIFLKNNEKNKYYNLSKLIKFIRFSIENYEKEIYDLENKIKQVAICLVKNKN